MKFTVDRDPGFAAIQLAASVIPTRTTIPILQFMRIEAAADTVTFTGTDLDKRVSVCIPARVEREGAITVEADKFSRAVQNMYQGADFTFDYGAGEDPRADLKSGKARFKMPTLPADQFSMIKHLGANLTLEMAAPVLDRLFEVGGSTVASTGDARDYMKTAYIHTEGDKVRVVSTNGHVMTWCQADAPIGFNLPIGAMITQPTIATIRRMIAQAAQGSPVAMSFGENKLSMVVPLAAGEATLISKLQDPGTGPHGGFVPYWQMVPKDLSRRFSADMDLLEGALRRVMVMMDPRLITVRIALSAGMAALSARNAQTGAATDDVEVEYEGDDYLLSLDGEYFRDVLSRIRTENVVVRMTEDPKRAITVTETGDSDWFCVLAPKTA